MASVTSLGVHQPTGLRHAIDEGILSPDPPASSYTWEVFTDSDGDTEFEDELLTVGNCVLWSRGGIFRKSFKFDLEKEAITQALLTYFPASADGQEAVAQVDKSIKNPTAQPMLSRALVVFLKTQAHVYFLSGASHAVHMPFEVESACPAPCGVIIQRRAKTNNTYPMSLRLPKVPPNSFLSSQPSPQALRGHKATEFSIEALGNPQTLPLRLSSTLENMWQPLMETSDSHWPRLICLTDPLLEIGLVVTQPDRSKPTGGRRSSIGSPFLNPAEEILHVQAINLPGLPVKDRSELNIAVTVNRETSMYSVWRLSYLEIEDLFLGGRQTKKKTKPSRRRSSMAPGLASGAATPVHPSMKESFGAPLPGKKNKKSVKIEGNNKALENALSSLDPEKGGDAARRQSRRVSSLLARADLSASQDRASFTEQPLHTSHAGKRVESHGSQRARMSGGHGGPSFSGTFNPLNSLNEADSLLEELRAGGDFEGFNNMGLDDHDFDGLTREMLFTKIHSIPMDNANVRYSLSSKPARTQSKVFILVGPPTATDEHGRTQLLVAIQDPVDKRLQILTLYVDIPQYQAKAASGASTINIICGELRRAQSVVDSCKISDGDETILILSEDKSAGRELSLQSPWSKLTTIHVPLLFVDNLESLDYSGSHRVKREVRARRSVGTGVSGMQFESVCHSNRRGVVDLLDRDGQFHQVRIKLQPSSCHVRKTLEACRGVLPATHAEIMLAGWWHVMQWLEDVKSQGLHNPPVDAEWSSLTILILASFLVLDHSSEASLRTIDDNSSWVSARNSWEAMQLHETKNSSAYPPWMRNKGWHWLLEEGTTMGDTEESNISSSTFMAVHISLAKKFITSAEGMAAFGQQGYLPTALSVDRVSRNTTASSLMIALHLIAEEDKLTILLPEDSTSGQSDLTGLLCQLARWLGWHRYEAIYELGLQAQLPPHDSPVPFIRADISEPTSNYCILTWIQANLNNKQSNDFITLPEVYAKATGDTLKDSPRMQLWDSLTPRTLMFEKLFTLIKSTRNHVEMVVAMHQCGFNPQILETLPEAVMTPLQDVIFVCQPNPPSTWPKKLLSLVDRTDISDVLRQGKVWRATGSDAHAPTHIARWDFRILCQHLDDFHDQVEETDGTERQAVVRTLFKEDRRLNEAQNLLSTTKPRVLRLDHKNEWTEPEYLERQKEVVTTVATNTLAIPAGRGLLYYSLRYPLLTQKYHISGFNLTCFIKPANNTVGVDKSLFTEEKINWAFFHQGVAGGLAISPHAKGIDTSWILYNKPGQDLSNRHAGFLLALGLNGHLKSVAKWVAFKYLTPKHTMTSIGLLLGLAASYIGTMDSLITRLLSVHVTRMLPRGAAELNLSKHTQTTGIMGIGLLYCNSQHRRMSEIMMSEIEYADDGDDEDPLRDEGYRLAAGFALGFINLGKGNDLKGLQDMRLTEKLLSIATSTKSVELVHVLDRSSAAAVVAIALIFMKSEDQIVARKIDVPDTILQFDYVRPDILLLRTVAKNIILWSEIDPSFEWIKNGLPKEYRMRSKLTNITRLRSRDLSIFSIVAGLCFSLGLRFAGSANVQVRDLLVHYLDEFMRIVRLPAGNFDAEMARGNARMCMDMVALSSATVMAGTGDLVVLRRLRALHGRDDPDTPYGSHLAAHLAVGALFLGCGTATFSTSNLAIAALIVSFYPLFPSTVQDNRSHLQAFRHFWVLATDPRCLVTKDLATGQPLNVPVLIELKPGSPSAAAAAATTKGTAYAKSRAEPITIRRQTPCLLPPLDDVTRVRTDAAGLGFWDLAIDFARQPSLVDDFHKNQSLYLRRRPASESTFPATLRALGTSEKTEHDPLEWLFALDALKDLTHAERAVVLDRLGSGGGIGEGEGASTAVDARLVLRNGLDGWSRDRLLGLRLLFGWADRRSSLVLAKSGATGAAVDDSGGKAEKKEKGKGKSVKGGKRKKVSVATPLETVDAATVGQVADNGGYSWWLRDSIIDELKGRAWLAGREE
ncbi:putative APC1 protein [Apodospora peruviana]|uniref:APC1 protein n=1 Tax=Apodospora peruviana TaxID=516989 RepID=A0AAE0HU35_9PEZI|nr:putative APC1 protein [Apodospora peruviana]